ncbi:FAD:protein FMN transferase [Candidatus Manganitrophus noduliformans]|nr:FAD:protein FMN transferase [Candidatus Manganitrophus noduliformans]
MGSPVEITAYGEKEICSNGIEAAFLEIGRIERLLSVYQPDSVLSRVNRFSKKGFISVPREVLDLLSESIRYAKESQGAFDITAGPLVRLWGFGPGKERGEPPSREEIAAACRSVGSEHVRIHFDSGELELLQEGMELNLGGIGKGYAIDRAAHVLKAFGVTRALISSGSTLFALGSPPGQRGWPVLIRHPRLEKEEIGTLFLCHQALSTSGDYEKFFVFQGRRFSHLIDPRTGAPAAWMASVSVVAPGAMEADALSTAGFILGEREGSALLKRFSGAEGLFVAESSEGNVSFHATTEWRRVEASYSPSRRRFLTLLSGFFIGLMVPLPARATVVYAKEEEALRRMMPEADRFDADEIDLSPDQLSKAQNLTGKGFRDKKFLFKIGRKGKETVGYAVRLEAIGKERPITFLIGINSDGTVKGAEVLIYRESEGSEIRHPRFMAQFLRKTVEDPLRPGQDIQVISGATLSSRAAAYVVRKALSIFEAVYKKG